MASLHYQTLREKVAELIRYKIIHQELKPGERIIEQDLAEEFQTSRGPIREALRDLENEGLIEYTRNIGCTVKTITLDDAYEIYLLRASYEIMAVKLVDGNIPEETLDNMKELLRLMENLDVKEYEKIVDYDNAFHEEIVKMAGMERIYKAWSMLMYGNIATGYSQNLDKKKRLQNQKPSHEMIVEACEEKDSKKICKALADHYWRTICRLMKEKDVDYSDKKVYWDAVYHN